MKNRFIKRTQDYYWAMNFYRFRNAIKHYLFIELNNVNENLIGQYTRSYTKCFMVSVCDTPDMKNLYSIYQRIYCSPYLILQIGLSRCLK